MPETASCFLHGDFDARHKRCPQCCPHDNDPKGADKVKALNETAKMVVQLATIARAELIADDSGICAARYDGVLVVVAVNNEKAPSAYRIEQLLLHDGLVERIETAPIPTPGAPEYGDVKRYNERRNEPPVTEPTRLAEAVWQARSRTRKPIDPTYIAVHVDDWAAIIRLAAADSEPGSEREAKLEQALRYMIRWAREGGDPPLAVVGFETLLAGRGGEA